MKSERDATRIVQSWLEVGSTGIPDRVLDAVVAELPSRPQRRSRWSPRRTSTMKVLIPIAATAAVLVVAVVIGLRFLPGEAGVGGTGTFVGGQFTFAEIPVDIDASSDGSSLSGTAVGAFDGQTFEITLQCLRQFDDETWMFAGELAQSADPSQPAGSWATVIVRDGPTQKAGIYIQPGGTADDCEEFVGEVPGFAVEGRDMIGDVTEGSIILPPAP